MSHAPGLSGMPDWGHCSRAATRVPCARSSARPTSRTRRVRDAISLADSIRQTASIVRWISGRVMVTIYLATEFTETFEKNSFSLCSLWQKILPAKDFVDLACAFASHLPEAPREFNGFFLRFGFDECKAHDCLFRLGERTVSNGNFAARGNDVRGIGSESASRQ